MRSAWEIAERRRREAGLRRHLERAQRAGVRVHAEVLADAVGETRKRVVRLAREWGLADAVERHRAEVLCER